MKDFLYNSKTAKVVYNIIFGALSFLGLQKILENIRFSYVADVPPHLYIELNNTCNLNCIMCPRKNLKRKFQNMDFNLYKKIIDESARIGISDVKLFLFGEPLMYSKLADAIKYAKKKGIKKVGFSTNGQLFNEKKAKDLLNSGVDLINFSIDGVDKKTYESIRRKGNFERVMANIKKLIEIRKSLKLAKPRITISTIVMKQTGGKINAFVNEWGEIVDDVIVEKYITYGGIRDYSMWKKARKHPCFELWDKMVILCNGDVTVCCPDFNGELKIGNVNKDSVKELWHSGKFEALRNMHRRREFDKMPLCKNCDEIFYKKR